MLGSLLVDRDRYRSTEEAWIFDDHRYTFTQDEPYNPILIINEPEYYLTELHDCDREVQEQYPEKHYLLTKGDETKGITKEEYAQLRSKLLAKGMRRVCTTLTEEDGEAHVEGLLHVTKILSAPAETAPTFVELATGSFFRLSL